MNCGLPAIGRETRRVARTTAAHSTVTINDMSSCRILTRESSAARRRGDLAGPSRIPVERRRGPAPSSCAASHDGYADVSASCTSAPSLADDGRPARGRRQFRQPAAQPAKAADVFATPLPPAPERARDRSPTTIAPTLVLPNREMWKFDADEDRSRSRKAPPRRLRRAARTSRSSCTASPPGAARALGRSPHVPAAAQRPRGAGRSRFCRLNRPPRHERVRPRGRTSTALRRPDLCPPSADLRSSPPPWPTATSPRHPRPDLRLRQDRPHRVWPAPSPRTASSWSRPAARARRSPRPGCPCRTSPS